MASTAANAAGGNAAAGAAALGGQPAAPAHGNTVGFRTKTMNNNTNGTSASPQGGFSFPDNTNANGVGGTFGVTSDRIKLLAGMLAKLPDLDLSEMARVKACFTAVLGEGRENIVNGLELRVVLGELGVYPSENELSLILRAYRDRVNLVTLTQYLRLYKKEFWVARAAAATAAVVAAGNPGSTAAAGAGAPYTGRDESSPSTGAHSFKAFSGSRAKPGVIGQSGDEDTLKAFVALGGEEDGGGEIDAGALRDAIRGFGLTIDIDAMIRTVDVHHSGVLDYVDFCALWSSPAGADGTNANRSMRNEGSDLTMGEALLRESAENIGSRRHSSIASPNDTAHQRLMSVLGAATPRRTSLAAGALRRRSQMLVYAHELANNNAGSAVRGSSPGSTRTPQDGAGAVGPYGARSNPNASSTSGATTALAAHKSVMAPPPTPLAEDEHMLLVSMYLFPELYEHLIRRAPRFAAGGNGTGGAANGQGGGGGNGAESLAFTGSTYQKRLSRQVTSAGARARSRSQGRTLGASSKKGRGGGGGGGGGEESGAMGTGIGGDFFSPKNQNVYRPPSPMILSMRNSTAYRNRLKRLEEQRRTTQAASGPGNGGGAGGAHGGNAAGGSGGLAQTTQPPTRGSLGGRGDGDFDGAAPASAQKGATW